MSNFTSYPTLSLGLQTPLLTCNLILVKRKGRKLTKTKLPNVLEDYDASEITRASLEGSDEEGYNIYTVEKQPNNIPLDFNLILYVTNSFEGIKNTGFLQYNVIGSTDIPLLKVKDSETNQKLKIKFNLGEVIKLEDNTYKNLVLNINYRKYSFLNLGKEGYINKDELKDYFSCLSKPHLVQDSIVDLDYTSTNFIPGGSFVKGKAYIKKRLNLDISSLGELKTWQSLSTDSLEYLKVENTEGVIALINITNEPDKVLNIDTISNSLEDTIIIKPEDDSFYIVNPDYIHKINKSNKRLKTRMKTDIFCLDSTASNFSEFNKNNVSENDKDLVDLYPESIMPSNISIGTKVNSDTTFNSMYGSPYSTNWHYDYEFSTWINNLDIFKRNSFDYSIKLENKLLFIIEKYRKGTLQLSGIFVLDYLGNTLTLDTEDYIMDPDGVLIVNHSNSNIIAYMGSLEKRKIIKNNLDLFSVFPSATELIFNNHNFSKNKILLCRDRLQELIN